MCDSHIWLIKRCITSKTVAICLNCPDPCAQVHLEVPVPIYFNPCENTILPNHLETTMKKITFDIVDTTKASSIYGINIIPLKFGMDIEVSTEFETFVMCEAFPVNIQTIDILDILHTDNIALTKNFVAKISISGRIPSTEYKVFCATRSIEFYDVVLNEAAILNTNKTIKTLCCIPIYVNLINSKINSGDIPAKNFLNID